MPPVVVTGPGCSATSNTSNGEGSSRLFSSFSRLAENTSNGPQKSSTSMSSNRTMPTRFLSICTSLPGLTTVVIPISQNKANRFYGNAPAQWPRPATEGSFWKGWNSPETAELSSEAGFKSPNSEVPTVLRGCKESCDSITGQQPFPRAIPLSAQPCSWSGGRN